VLNQWCECQITKDKKKKKKKEGKRAERRCCEIHLRRNHSQIHRRSQVPLGSCRPPLPLQERPGFRTIHLLQFHGEGVWLTSCPEWLGKHEGGQHLRLISPCPPPPPKLQPL